MHIFFFICTEHLSNVHGSPSLAAEQPEHETDHSPAPHAGDANVCSYIFLFPSICLHGKPRGTFTILCHLHKYRIYQLSYVSVYFPTSYLLKNLHLCMSFSSDESRVLLWLWTLLCGGSACFSVCDALLVSAEPTTCQRYTADVYDWLLSTAKHKHSPDLVEVREGESIYRNMQGI